MALTLKKKRILSFILALIMLFSLMPASAFADDEDEYLEEQQNEYIEPQDEEYAPAEDSVTPEDSSDIEPDDAETGADISDADEPETGDPDITADENPVEEETPSEEDPAEDEQPAEEAPADDESKEEPAEEDESVEEKAEPLFITFEGAEYIDENGNAHYSVDAQKLLKSLEDYAGDEEELPSVILAVNAAAGDTVLSYSWQALDLDAMDEAMSDEYIYAAVDTEVIPSALTASLELDLAEVLFNIPDAYICTVTASSGDESVQQQAYFTVAGAQAMLLSDLPEASGKSTYASFDEARSALLEYAVYYMSETPVSGKMAHNLYCDPILSGTSGRYQAFSIDINIPFDTIDTYWSTCNFNTDKSSLNLPAGTTFMKDPKGTGTNDGGGYTGIQNNDFHKLAIASIWDTEPNLGQQFGNGTRYSAQFISSDLGSGDRFSGEGTGARCRNDFDWSPNRWYRCVVRAYDATVNASGKRETIIDSWIQDKTTGEWTLIARYSTGLTSSCLTGALSQFVENFTYNYEAVRAVKWKNIYVLEKEETEWTAIESAKLSTDGFPKSGDSSYNKKGAFAFGAEEDYFWAISCGLGPDSTAEQREIYEDIINTDAAPNLYELPTYSYPTYYYYPRTEAEFVNALESARKADGHSAIIIQDVNINLTGTYNVSNKVDSIWIEADYADASLNLIGSASLTTYCPEIQVVGTNGHTATLTIEKGVKFTNGHTGGQIGLNQYMIDGHSVGNARLINHGRFDGSSIYIYPSDVNTDLVGEYSSDFIVICFAGVNNESKFADALQYAEDIKASGSVSRVYIYVTDSFELSKNYTIPSNVLVFLGRRTWPSSDPHELTIPDGVTITNYGRFEIYSPFKLVICQGARFDSLVNGCVNGPVDNNGIQTSHLHDRYAATEEELHAILNEYPAKDLRIHVTADITLTKRLDIGTSYGFIELIIEPGVTFEIPAHVNFYVENHSSVIIRDGATLINSSFTFDINSGTVTVDAGGTLQNNNNIWVGASFYTSVGSLIVNGSYIANDETHIQIRGLNSYIIGIPEDLIGMQWFRVTTEEEFAYAASRASESSISTNIEIAGSDITLTGQYTIPRNVYNFNIVPYIAGEYNSSLTLAPGAKLSFYGDEIKIRSGGSSKLIISEGAELFVSGKETYSSTVPIQIPTKIKVYSYDDITSYLINNGTISTDYGIAIGRDEYAEISGVLPDNIVFIPVDEYGSEIITDATQLDIYMDGKKVTGQTVSISRTNTKPIKLTAKIAPADALQIAYWEVRSFQSAAYLGYADINQLGELTFNFDKIPSYYNEPIEVYAYTRKGMSIMATVKFQIEKPVTEIMLSGVNSLPAGTSSEIYANVWPSNATNRKVVWTSSDENVATVTPLSDSNGRARARVTAKTVNERTSVTITATAADGSGVSASKTIYVTPVVSKVDIVSPETEEILTGQTLYIDMGEENPARKLAAMVQPEGASQTVTWKSSAPTVVSVDNTGLVTPLKVGSATITATASGKTATVTVKVSAMVHSIEIDGNGIVAVGKTTALKALVLPDNASNKTVTWSVEPSDSTVATVSTSGVVTGKVPGTVTITATAKDGSNISGSKEITVIPVGNAVSILDSTGSDITGGKLSIDTASDDLTIQLSALVSPYGAVQDIVWKSSNAKVAAVSTDGLVVGLANGTATISATTTDGSNKTASVTVTVAKLVHDINITSKTGDTVVTGGKTLALAASVDPVDATNKQLVWTTSDAAVATVSNGTVTAKKVTEIKTVTITAAAKDDSGVSKDIVLTVVPASTAVVIEKDGENIGGKTTPVISNATPKLNLTAYTEPAEANKAVTWKTSNAKIATVDENGLVSFLGANGKVTITATAADGTNISKAATFTVTTNVSSIEISSARGTELAVGKTLPLTATVEPASAGNKAVTWSSDNPSIATVSTSGVVTGKATGTVTITATAKDGSGISGTIEITVLPAVKSLAIMDGKVDITGMTTPVISNVTKNIQLTAYTSDGASNAVTWKTSNAKIATVDENGLVSFLGVSGKVTITATTADGSNVSKNTIFTVTTNVGTIEINSPRGNELAVGKTLPLTATVEPASAGNKAVTWSSDNPSIATVSTSGVVTGKATGTVTITATAKDGSGIFGTIDITVRPAVKSLAIMDDEVDITGKTTPVISNTTKEIQLTAYITADGASNNVTWKTSNAKIATVDEHGLVSFLGANGKVTITATAADGTNISKSTIFSVTTSVDSVEIGSQKGDVVAVGKSLPLTATVEPMTASNKAVAWSSGNTSIATVSSAGVVTGKAPGTVTITATAKDDITKTASFSVEVLPAVSSVEIHRDGELVNGKTVGIDLNGNDMTVQLDAATLPEKANNAVAWKSSNAKVASVDENGLVTVLGAGSADITATATDGSGKSAKVRINAAALVSEIRLSGSNTVAVGKTLNLMNTAAGAGVFPANAANKALLWTSSDTSIATVSSAGVVTPKANATGKTVTVTAEAKDGSGVKVSREISILPATTAVSVFKDSKNVTGAFLTVFTDDDIAFTAIATPDGASSSFVWTSNNSYYAAVSDGVVTLKGKSGIVTITATATDGTNKSASVILNIVQK